METVELGSYEKCQDLRALLKRKHRFILLRSPGNKVGLCLLLSDLPPGQGLLAKITPRAFLRQAGPPQVGRFAHFVLESPQLLVDRRYT